MKTHKKEILQLLEQYGDSLSAKQIRGALGLKKAATEKLKAELIKMVNKGLLVKQGTRYNKSQWQEKKQQTENKTENKTKKKIGKVVQANSPWSAQPKVEIQKENTDNHKSKHSKPDPNNSGYFTRNPKGFGFVAVGQGRPDVFIGESDQGQAMEGDRVEIEPTRKRGFQGRVKGRIIRILERASSEILARVKRSKREVIAIPVQQNSGIPFIRISPEDDLTELETGVLVEVELLENESSPLKISRRKSTYDVPFGKILRVMEKTDDHDLSFQLILKENLIRTEFPQAVNEFADRFSNQVRFDPDSGRTDLRHLDFVTIDGKTARDFDDAICVVQEDSGLYRLYIAIADVAHYVQPNDPVDEEALIRGTSVYFPTYALPMLPEVLCNQLCSLRPNVNRLTLTCEMLINDSGEVLDYGLSESMIRSRARLVYEDVTNLLEGKTSVIRNPELKQQLFQMQKLAKILEKKRIERGAVQFSFSEEVFEFDAEQQMTGVGRSYQSVAMKLIEQFMLEANETVAAHCTKNKLHALYRVHDKPDMGKLVKLQQTFHRFGVNTSLAKLEDPKVFNTIIDQIQDLPQFEQLQVMLLRTMSLAVYQTENKGHFGLAAEHYAHFTSPIRRYPDLVVHRAIKQELMKIRAKEGKSKNRQQIKMPEVNGDLAEQCSQLERRAEKAERQSVDLMKVEFLSAHAGQSFQAVVVSIDSQGFRVNIETHGIEWFLSLESLHDDWYVYDSVRLSLQGRNKNRTLQSGQRLEIKLLRADVLQRKLEFQVENWLS